MAQAGWEIFHEAVLELMPRSFGYCDFWVVSQSTLGQTILFPVYRGRPDQRASRS